MSDYYIRITDEEPVDMEKGVRFRYNGTGTEDEFTIVGDSDYRTLVEQFEQFSEDTTRIVNYNLDNILSTKIVPLAQGSKTIVDDDNLNSISYDEILNMMDSYASSDDLDELSQSLTQTTNQIQNQINTISTNVGRLESSKASLAQVNTMVSNLNTKFNNYYTKTEVDSKLNGKANSSHTHSSWTSIELGGGWTSDDCWCQVNTATRTAHYHIKTLFDSATGGKKYEWGSGTVGTVPSAYRPSGARFGICRTENNAYGPLWVTSEGKIGAVFSKGWTNATSVYGDIWWKY